VGGEVGGDAPKPERAAGEPGYLSPAALRNLAMTEVIA